MDRRLIIIIAVVVAIVAGYFIWRSMGAGHDMDDMMEAAQEMAEEALENADEAAEGGTEEAAPAAELPAGFDLSQFEGMDEDAIRQAIQIGVDAGAMTQEQADAILSQIGG